MQNFNVFNLLFSKVIKEKPVEGGGGTLPLVKEGLMGSRQMNNTSF